LNGKSRFELIKDQPAGDLNTSPTNHLQAIFQNFSKMKRISDITFEAFGLYFLLDPTNLGTLKIKLSKEPLVEDIVSISSLWFIYSSLW
jgi:hypothetical protein